MERLNPHKTDISTYILGHKQHLFSILVTVMAVWIRYEMRGFESLDFKTFLLPWAQYLESKGGFAGIATGPPNCNYPVSYQYILALLTYLPFSFLSKIKLVSVLFDFITAVVISLIVKEIGHYPKGSYVPLTAYAVSLFAPTIILNSAVWGQSDSIHTAFIIVTVYFLLKEKYTWAFISFGIAFAFKLQAVFFMPVLLLLYFNNHEFSFWNFLLIPSVWMVVGLPAILIGKPLEDVFSVYLSQTQQYQKTVWHFPNIYTLLPDKFQHFAVPGVLYTFTIIAIVYFIIISKSKKKIVGPIIIDVSLLTIMICTYLLPSMHERYLFTGDILAIIYLFSHKDRLYIPPIIWLISLNGYIHALYRVDYYIIEPRVLAVVFLGVLIILTQDLLFNNSNSMIPPYEGQSPIK